MSYLFWALIAMAGYGATAVLLKAGLRNIPPEVAVVVTNSLLVIMGVVWAVYRGVNIPSHLSFSWPTSLLILAGLLLGVSIISYYLALSRGPASVVVPVFSMSLAVASGLSFLFLGEAITLSRMFGLLLAAGAVFLLAR